MIMKQTDIQDFNLGQEAWTPEQGDTAKQQIRQLLTESNLNTTKLAEIGQWAQRVIENPKEFPSFQSWLKEQGLPESEIPQEPDYQELSSMVAMGAVAGEMEQEASAAPQSAAPTGPVSPEQMAGMADQGRGGDTMLAHINPEEAAMLSAAGGMGTINPATGLTEYGFFGDLWRGVKKVVKAVAPIALPVIALFVPALIPAVGAALGASAALAPIVGAAAIAGGVTALSGGNVKEILTSAAITGLGSYLAPVIGSKVGSLTGITNTGVLSAIGSGVIGGGITAARGGSVTQILTAAAGGAASNYLGQLASSAINSGGITNSKITQKVFDDAVFAAADAEQMAAAGLSKMQIQQVLIKSGLDPAVSASAASGASQGIPAADIAVSLSNQYGSLNPAISGSKQPSLYANDATGVTNSLIGGANKGALEQVQRYEDGMMRAEQGREIMATLKADGIVGRAAQPKIQAQLIADGVDAKSAAYIANALVEHATSGNISSAIVDQMPNATLYGEKPAPAAPAESTPSVVTSQPAAPAATAPVPQGPVTPSDYTSSGNLAADIDFAVADAKQLAAQGLKPTQITETLKASGMSAAAATYLGNNATIGDGMLKYDLKTFDNYGKNPLYLPDPVTPAPVPMEISEAQFLAEDAAQLALQTGNNVAAIEQNLIYAGVDPVAAAAAANMAVMGMPIEAMTKELTDMGSVYDPAASVTTPVSSSGVSVETDASFAAADAEQLAKQGLSQAQIESTLLYSGMDPFVAADAASLAKQGYDAATITQLITDSGNTGAPGTAPVIYAGNDPQAPLPGYGGPPGSAPSGPVAPEIEPATLTPEQVGAITATPSLLDSATSGPAAGPQYSFTPQAPDARWSQPLQNPGLNPGLVGAGIRPAYDTSSPVQSQYYWGRQPFFNTVDDLAKYNQVPQAQQQPWGIQQGNFEQPVDYAALNTYGPNMFMNAPAVPIQPAVPARSYAPAAQQLQQTMPVAPNNYSYDVRAAPGQYTQIA